MQQLPCIAKKKRLFKHFNAISERELRKLMNKIISKNRNVDLSEAKKVKILRKNEVKNLMIELGEIEE